MPTPVYDQIKAALLVLLAAVDLDGAGTVASDCRYTEHTNVRPSDSPSILLTELSGTKQIESEENLARIEIHWAATLYFEEGGDPNRLGRAYVVQALENDHQLGGLLSDMTVDEWGAARTRRADDANSPYNGWAIMLTTIHYENTGDGFTALS